MNGPSVHIRNPGRRYTLVFTDPAWKPTLKYLECDPEIGGPPPESRELTIEPARHYVQLHEAGMAVRDFASVADLRDHLHARLFLESLAGTRPLLHAACLKREAQRILLVGPKSSGKSTLSLALGLSGYRIEGDENVFVTPAGVIARPRACRVKESSAAVLPDLAPLLRRAPFITDYHGRKIHNLVPSALGPPWQIEQGAVDAVFLLHANHGGMSSIRPAPPLALTRALMAETSLAATSRGAGVAAVAALGTRAAGYDLSLGGLDTAIACIDFVLKTLDRGRQSD